MCLILNKITLICVGKLKERFFTDACNEYLKRLGRFCSAEVKEISESRVSDNANESEISAAMAQEADKILSLLPEKAYVVAMCVEGEKISSEKFAKGIAKTALSGYNHTAFIIGGSNGLDEGLKKRADLRLSMSDMTFPHHLARVMLLEQIYRAFQINNNGKYHK